MQETPPGLRLCPFRAERRGFTLMEILLAISIATGLLIVAMIFYRQAADLRRQVLLESERLAAVRLVLDRCAVDLRSAQVGQGLGEEFRGGEMALSFVTAKVVLPVAGPGPDSVSAGADRARITFSLLSSHEGTNQSIAGFLRQEEPAVTAPQARTPRPGSVGVMMDSLESTNSVAAPTTEHIRFARFRYWDGGQWQSGWTNSAPPAGVEMVMGLEPAGEESSLENYPFEQFRRVVFVPSGQVAAAQAGSAVEPPFLPQ